MTDKKNKPRNPNRRQFLKSAGLIPAGLYLQANSPSATGQERDRQTLPGSESMMGHVAPALDSVRVGVIGAGRRGT